jgi:hypothetical protein
MERSGRRYISSAQQWGLLSTLTAAVLAFPIVAAAQAHTYARSSALHDFEASGPVRLATDQVASVCATNYDNSTESILLALVDATPGPNSGGILASQQSQVPPRATACLYLPGANLPGPQQNVVGLVVENGFVNQGVIQQGIGIGGGGCIASLQILDALNKTVVIAQMASHHLKRN